MRLTVRQAVAAAVAVVALAGGGVALALPKGSMSGAGPSPSGTPSSSPSGAVTSPTATGAAAVDPTPASPSPSPTPDGGWLSGLWTGGRPSAERLADFALWRGRTVGTAVVYPAYDTWDEIKTSTFSAELFTGFPGRLVYGLPLLPSRNGGTLDDVAAGRHDDAFLAVADLLAGHGREDSFIRIGLEANGDWFPWGADRRGNDAASFKAAFRHVSQLLTQRLPDAVIVFDISCGRGFSGGSGRTGALTALYPGDDVVDVVGCDTYDQYHRISTSTAEFTANLSPDDAVGLKDVVDFARQHGKQWAVPEWSIVGKSQSGGGDNPLFIREMFAFFTANKDDLAFENYFNEPADSLRSSIWGEVQNPKAAAEYRRLW